MGANTLTLIRTLAASSLDNRYENIAVVNRNPDTGTQGSNAGSLSVVFRAYDTQTNQDVALKFFDPDIQGITPEAEYRIALFRRESKILSSLVGKSRCLQLVQPLSEVEISVQQDDGHAITMRCGYFVLEWLDGDIRRYFQRQDEFDAIIKLSLFRQIVLGVFALHRENFAHRDLKDDNLMRVLRQNSEFVIPIDLGAAVPIDSSTLGTATNYAHPVGAPAFAPLEALIGFSGIRELAQASDIYALGCLLHDLFNTDLFVARLMRDPGFISCFGACHSAISVKRAKNSNTAALLNELDSIVDLTRNQVTLPSIASTSTTVPSSARDQLDRLLCSLTDVSYKRRDADLDRILRTLDSAIKVIEHSLFEEKRLSARRQYRRNRAIKQEQRQMRLEEFKERNV